MCTAPDPPETKDPKKPEFLRNTYLDEAIGQSGVVNALRQGRSTLRIPLGTTRGQPATSSAGPIATRASLGTGGGAEGGIGGASGTGRRINLGIRNQQSYQIPDNSTTI